MTDFKVSTMTVTAKFNSEINLMDVCQVLELDNEITGIKYKWGSDVVVKGIYQTSVYKRSKSKKVCETGVGFYNQISVVVRCDDKDINAKLFRNGSVHLTGVKSCETVYAVMEILRNKINACSGKIVRQIPITPDKNGINLSGEIIYSGDLQTILGHKVGDKYCIHRKWYSYDNLSNLLISEKFLPGRKRNLINNNGVVVGSTKIKLGAGRTKLYKSSGIRYEPNYDPPFYTIYYDSPSESIVLGRVVYDFPSPSVPVELSPKTIDYVCRSEQIPEGCTFDIDCINIYFSIGFPVNRMKMFRSLSDAGFVVDYKPEKYSGIKVREGKTLFLVFQSGNVIGTAFNSEETIQEKVDKFVGRVADLSSGFRMKCTL